MAVLLALALLSGCGISAQDQPRALTSGSPTPSPTPTSAQSTQQTTIYLVLNATPTRESKLTQRTRETPPDPSAQQVLDALQQEPSEQESNSGLTSGVTGTSVLEGPSSANGEVVTVEIPDMFLTADNLALGQIVLSLVRLPGVRGVQFARDGKRISAPNGEGVEVPGVLRAADYNSLIEG